MTEPDFGSAPPHAQRTSRGYTVVSVFRDLAALQAHIDYIQGLDASGGKTSADDLTLASLEGARAALLAQVVEACNTTDDTL